MLLLGVPSAVPLADPGVPGRLHPVLRRHRHDRDHPARDVGDGRQRRGHRAAGADRRPERDPGLRRPTGAVRPHREHPPRARAARAPGGLRAGRGHRPVRRRPGHRGRVRRRAARRSPSSSRTTRPCCRAWCPHGSTASPSGAGGSCAAFVLVAILVGIFVSGPAGRHADRAGDDHRRHGGAARRLAHEARLVTRRGPSRSRSAAGSSRSSASCCWRSSRSSTQVGGVDGRGLDRGATRSNAASGGALGAAGGAVAFSRDPRRHDGGLVAERAATSVAIDPGAQRPAGVLPPAGRPASIGPRLLARARPEVAPAGRRRRARARSRCSAATCSGPPRSRSSARPASS